ncbi:glycosyltransferase family 4 protein [Candidatus Bathyarchaeota archaeon A05DMB-2]|jgi:glycosyltransferase involved in cell wall biosynthesis|nr:glycosyltransferase family 4 protein [Candidatus Bathyarchaeota archaeon A05DMB-2]
MKKISLAVFNTQPPHLYFGGVERRIVETAHRLRGEIDITVYSGTKAGFKKPTTINELHLVPCFSTDALYPADNWFFNRSLAQAADAVEADIYEAHTVSGYGFQKALKKHSVQKPFIHTIHGVLADEYAQSFQSGSMTVRDKLANLMMYRLARSEGETARNATVIVTVSRYSSKKISQFYGVDPTKIKVVPNGVDPQRYKPFGSLEKIKHQIGIDNKLCVLFVGRLIPRKGLPYLVEAAKRVVKEFNVIFVIVGNGPLRGHLEAYLKKICLSRNFVFLGDVKENVLPAVYNCADVFALPSIQEGQGIALLEAQATAKPVVAFKVGGVPEAMLDGETGLLVKPSSRELSDALIKLLSSYSLRKQMGHRGREFVSKNFAWDICARKMLQVYHEALGV